MTIDSESDGGACSMQPASSPSLQPTQPCPLLTVMRRIRPQFLHPPFHLGEVSLTLYILTTPNAEITISETGSASTFIATMDDAKSAEQLEHLEASIEMLRESMDGDEAWL